VAVTCQANTWSKIAVGDATTCGLHQDGSLWCWGGNTSGQVGDGTTTTRYLPQPIGIGKSWTTVVTSAITTFGIASDGTLWRWGANTHGQLGNGTVGGMFISPVVLGPATWSAISVGSDGTFVCGIQTDGTLWCWGNNVRGQVGDGTTTDRSVPTQVGTDHDWASVSAGYVHACAIKADGSLWCWGHDGYGEIAGRASMPATCSRAGSRPPGRCGPGVQQVWNARNGWAGELGTATGRHLDAVGVGVGRTVWRVRDAVRRFALGLGHCGSTCVIRAV